MNINPNSTGDRLSSSYLSSNHVNLQSVLNKRNTLEKINIIIPQNEEEVKNFFDPYHLKRISGGITNRIFLISHPETSENHILRIYGQETDGLNIFDRDSEIESTVNLSKNGLGPRIHALFKNGRIESYYEGDVMTGFDYRSDMNIYKTVALEIKRNHDAAKSFARSPNDNEWAVEIFLRRFRNIIKSIETLDQYLLNSYPNIDQDIDNTLSSIKSKIKDHEVVGCHNDLHHGNMIIDKNKNIIRIIDFEYFGHNPFLYDICNYFNELCTFECDWTLYPELSERKIFYETYFNHELIESDLSEIDDKVIGLTKLNHLMWGMWGLVKHGLNVGEDAIDFNYVEYFHKRIGRFYQLIDQ